MTELTKEWLLKTIAELEEERDAVPGAVNENAAMALAAMKLALASLEAEPVAEVCEGFTLRYIGHGPAPKSGLRIGDRLYTAPPAPVVQCPFPCGWDNLNKLAIQDAAFVTLALVPGEAGTESIRQATLSNNDRLLKVISACRSAEINHMREQHEVPEKLKQLIADRIGITFSDEDAQGIWDSCRAAMLQGAGPATTANKLRDAVETIRSSGIAIDAEKILAERDALNSPVVPDGWVMVPVEPTMSQEFAGYRTLTDTGKMSRLMKTRLSNIYRAMIAAAPQQEISHAIAKGMERYGDAMLKLAKKEKGNG